MQDAYAALRAILMATPAVTAIVGDRIRAWPAGQALASPCVLIHVVSLRRAPTMEGSPTFDDALVQVDCIGRTHAERQALASAVRDALADYASGSVQRIFFDQYVEYVDDGSGSYRGMFEVRVVFSD